MKEREYTLIDNGTMDTFKLKAVPANLLLFLRWAESPWKFMVMLFAIVVLLSWLTGAITHAVMKSDKDYATENQELREQVVALEEELNVYGGQDSNIHSLIGEYTLIRTKNAPTMIEAMEFANKIGLWYPQITIAQYIQESGLGTSNVFKNSNNLCGMKIAHVRPTTQCGDYNGYGKYRNWQMCMIDTWLWERFSFSNKKPTHEEYLVKLGDIYAEDENYVSHLLSHIETINKKMAETDTIK